MTTPVSNHGSTVVSRLSAAARIATSSYRQEGLIRESGRIPVRITAGHPRFRLGFQIAATIKELAPSRTLFAIKDEHAFDVAYRSQLDQAGVELIGQKIADVCAAHGERSLVLLCFEDVAQLGELSCHRRSFAHWWEERTGEEVPELISEIRLASRAD